MNKMKDFFYSESFLSSQCILVSEEDELATFVDKPNRGKCVLDPCNFLTKYRLFLKKYLYEIADD